MKDTWATRFIDTQVERAWVDLRLQLADRFAAGMATGHLEPIEITAGTGSTLTVNIADEHLVILAGDDVHTTANVDAAAYEVFRILHDEWQVIHPVFLDSPVVDVPKIDDNPVHVVAPVLGKAGSKEQLHAWVVASFSEGRSEPVKVAPNGSIQWRTPGERVVMVRVRNAGRVEIATVLGQRVGIKKAHKVIDELSRKYFGLKFFLVQDTLMMSQIVIAQPFCGEQLDAALRTFVSNTDSLGWVAEKVLRKRVKVERDALAKAQAATKAAETALAEAQAQVKTAERIAERRKLERARASRNYARVRAERDAARAELARLTQRVERALGHQSSDTREGGEVA